MRCDLHIHLASEPPQGELSERLRRQVSFRWLQWSVAPGPDPSRRYRETVVSAVAGSALEGAVVLALDRPYSEVGLALPPDLYVANDQAAALCREQPKLRWGASVHPYRPDAFEALEEAIALRAALCKWLPNVQRIDPAAARCRPFLARLRELGLPLLSHTGAEHTLPAPAQDFGRLERLVPALEAGVTVIAAHAGTGSRTPLSTIVALCARYPRLFLECSALWTPHRLSEMRRLLAIPALRTRWVYGSDYPVPIFWPLFWGRTFPGLPAARALPNPLDRRAALAEVLGVPSEAFARGGELLRG